MSDWKLQSQLTNWSESSVDSLKMIHNKGNEVFLHTVQENHNITKRAFTLISILLPVVTFILVALGQPIYHDGTLRLNQFLVILIAAVPSLYCLFLLYKLVFPSPLIEY